MQKDIKTIIYNDILNEKQEFNAFKVNSSFPTNELNATELISLKKCSIAETFFYGNNNFDQTFDFFKTGLKERLIDKLVYLFICEHKPSKVTKLKSYKGLVDKTKISPDNFVQCETMIDDKASLLSALIKIQYELLDDYFLDFFLDSSRSFVFDPRIEDFRLNCGFNNEIVSQCISIDETVEINYLRLMLNYCPLGFDIYRVGGDGVGGYWSLQKFFFPDEVL